MRWFRFAVLVLVTSLLQTGLVRLLAVGTQIKPDLLLILLVFFSLRAKTTDAIIASFALGFAADLTNPAVSRLMGPRMLSFGLFGTLLSDLGSTITPSRFFHYMIAIFLTGMLTASLSDLLVFLRGEPIPVSLVAGLFWQPLYSAVLGPLLFLPLGWLMRMYGRGRGRRAGGPSLR